MTRIKFFGIGSYDKCFALNHDKSLQIYFFCVKHQAKNDFLEDVESTAEVNLQPVDVSETAGCT